MSRWPLWTMWVALTAAAIFVFAWGSPQRMGALREIAIALLSAAAVYIALRW